MLVRGVCSALLLVLALIGPACALEPLRLGVHPYLPATELLDRFAPLAQYLSGKMGRQVDVFVARDYEDQIDHIGGGEYDIAYMGPASYVELVDKYGKVPLLARLAVEGKPTFRGVIISRDL
jgi:phosphonate transport system substrate-binding protein